MSTKLTLTVEKHVIEKAKIYARKTGRSLSEIIETYLESLTSDISHESNSISPKLRAIIGSVKLPKDFDEEKARRSHLENKHK